MMIPWDFGLINSLKAKLKMPIFPSTPPDADELELPYLIFEVADVKHASNQNVRLDIRLKIVDIQQPIGLINEYLHDIKQAISSELKLFSAQEQLGFAKIKIDKLAITKNATILHLVALLRLQQTEGKSHE